MCNLLVLKMSTYHSCENIKENLKTGKEFALNSIMESNYIENNQKMNGEDINTSEIITEKFDEVTDNTKNSSANNDQNVIPVCQWTQAFKNVIDVYSDSESDKEESFSNNNSGLLNIVIKEEKTDLDYTPNCGTLSDHGLQNDINAEEMFINCEIPLVPSAECQIDSMNSQPVVTENTDNDDVQIINQYIYRPIIYESGSDSDSVVEVSSSSSEDNCQHLDNENNLSDGEIREPVIKKNNVPKKKKTFETDYEDLPPIHELQISLDENEELRILGSVVNIIETKVIILSEKDIPALNLDTILFKEDRKPIGQVFDVFSRVVCPRYVVLLSSPEEAEKQGIEVGTKIYYAPKAKGITSYVFLSSLLKEKGSDASWEADHEPPEQHIEYSDDEKEREAKKKSNKKHQRKRPNTNRQNKDETDTNYGKSSDFFPGYRSSATNSYMYQMPIVDPTKPSFQTGRQFFLKQSRFFQPALSSSSLKSQFSQNTNQQFGQPPQFRSSFVSPSSFLNHHPATSQRHFSTFTTQNLNYFTNTSSQKSLNSSSPSPISPPPPPFTHSLSSSSPFSHSPPSPPPFTPTHHFHQSPSAFISSAPTPFSHTSAPFPTSPPPPSPFSPSTYNFSIPPAPSNSSFSFHSSPPPPPLECRQEFGQPWVASRCPPPFGQPNLSSSHTTT